MFFIGTNDKMYLQLYITTEAMNLTTSDIIREIKLQRRYV